MAATSSDTGLVESIGALSLGQEPRSLRQEFRRGTKLYRMLEDSPLSASDEAFQASLKETQASLTRCAALVQRLGVFSNNEILEDVNTKDLRYVLVDAYLADVIVKNVGGDRENTLKAASQRLELFLGQCEQLEILSKEDKDYLENDIQLDKAKKAFNPAKQREQKILRYKREKKAKATLEELESQLALQSKSAGKRGNEIDDEDADDDSYDDDLMRAIILATIDIYIQKSLEALRMIGEELELLRNKAPSTRSLSMMDNSNRVEAKGQGQSLRYAGGAGPLLGGKGEVLRPFVITSQREAVRSKVFGYGHNLPTMSVEEYLDKEMERGNIISGGGKMPEAKITDDNDEAAVDAETYKAREWDEFKDVNPTGWGNRHNKG
ncbi:TAP42-like protein [Fimicolochytrium jonesii]|uniref:TAP42-like protein n=1 Tax=Fimicolochytrium jonesii TaxID=1396493 RepID=UPI0022FE6661|nr:TAP42-like protein [Fimicolochytrium jonesii]KAI8816686.1 TAP42-like protein [Fimicolochytrium jonesii]